MTSGSFGPVREIERSRPGRTGSSGGSPGRPRRPRGRRRPAGPGRRSSPGRPSGRNPGRAACGRRPARRPGGAGATTSGEPSVGHGFVEGRDVDPVRSGPARAAARAAARRRRRRSATARTISGKPSSPSPRKTRSKKPATGSGLKAAGPPAMTSGCALSPLGRGQGNAAEVEDGQDVGKVELVEEREADDVEVAGAAGRSRGWPGGARPPGAPARSPARARRPARPGRPGPR